MLLVDGDPQCGLTSYLLPDETVDDLLNEADGLQGRTIWSAVKPVLDGERPRRSVAPVSVGARVALVPGDIRLFSFERFLNDAWAGSLRRRLDALRATSSISTFVSQIHGQSGYDFVLFDSGSNLGPLSRVLLLDSDYLVIPVASDVLTVRALSTLGQAASKWMSDADTINAIAPDDMPLLKAKPILLGYILQRFGTSGRVLASEADACVSEMSRRIRDDVALALHQHGESLLPAPRDDSPIAQVADLASLVQVARHEGVAIWECSEGTPAQRHVARRTFAHVAAYLEEVVGVQR